MPVYLYQGQHYTIATDDPAEAKRKIIASLPPEKSSLDYVRDLGKSTASLADTGINAVTGTLDQLAYPLARAFGRSPEQATAETTSPKDFIGRALGITQDPAYQQELSRRLMSGVGEGIQNYVVDPVSQATGLPPQDVASMTGTAMAGVAPAVGRATAATAGAVGRGASAIGSGLKTAATAPIDMARGAFNAATGGETALAPLGKTYVTPEGADLFRQGRIDIATLESPQYTRPISELATGAMDRAALKVAGNQIPMAGQGAQAFGERVMSDYIANPYKAAVDIGLPFLTGGAVPPIYALGRGLQAGADMRLASKGFDPGLQQQVAAAKTQQAFQQPQAPRLTYDPAAPGPVDPTTMYATPGGQVGTNLPQVGQAALAEKYPPAPASPAQASQQAAAARIQPVVPEQQAIVDQATTQAQQEAARVARVTALQQRAQAAGGYTPPAAQAPVPAPVQQAPAPQPAPASTPTAQAPVSVYKNPTQGRSAVQTAKDNGEPITIRYKTSNGMVTEHVNQPITNQFDPDLNINHRITNPNDTITMFGVKQSSNTPIKVEVMSPSNLNNTEFIKVFDNSNSKKPVVISTYDSEGIMTSSPKNAPKGNVANMMTEEQLKMFNALKRSENTADMLQQLKNSNDPRAKSLAELLEKQGYNHKK